MKKAKINILFACLTGILLCFASCEKDTDTIGKNIVGTWQLISLTVDGVDGDRSSTPDLMRFQSNFIFIACASSQTASNMQRGGWSYENGMLNISIYLPAAFYVLQADGNILKIKRLDFNTEGRLVETVYEYRRCSDTLIQL